MRLQLILTVLLASVALPAEGTTARAKKSASTASKTTAAKAKAKDRAYNPTNYLKQQATAEAVDGADATQPQVETAKQTTVVKSITCIPEDPPPPCEPGDVNCGQVEIEVQPKGGAESVGSVPAAEDMAKAVFSKIRERCRPEGEKAKTFEPVVGLSVAPPAGNEKAEPESIRSGVMNMGRRVGATVGFKAEF